MSSRTSSIGWTLRAGGLVPLPLLLAGCLSMEVPEGFLVIEKERRQIKATTPDEARLWVRVFDDPYGGSLAFWADALRNELVANRGYVLVEERKVRDRKGHEGVELLMETTAQGVAQRYLVALFAAGGRIRVGELVAPRPVFDRCLEEVRKAFATISF